MWDRGVQLHFFLTSALDSSRWSTAHWPLDPNVIHPGALSKGGWVVPRRCAYFGENKNVSNFGSNKTILYVEPIYRERKETTRKTKLTKYETTFKVSE